MTKIRLYEKLYNFKTKQIFRFKILYDKFKIGIRIMLKFKARTVLTDGEITRKKRYGRLGPGQVRSGRAGQVGSSRIPILR